MFQGLKEVLTSAFGEESGARLVKTRGQYEEELTEAETVHLLGAQHYRVTATISACDDSVANGWHQVDGPPGVFGENFVDL